MEAWHLGLSVMARLLLLAETFRSSCLRFDRNAIPGISSNQIKQKISKNDAFMKTNTKVTKFRQLLLRRLPVTNTAILEISYKIN